MSKISIICTTFSSKEEASKFSEYLVLENLAACVQISQIESFYMWEGLLNKALEFKLEIKASIRHQESIINYLSENHPYDTPEILVIEAQASKKYLQWVENKN